MTDRVGNCLSECRRWIQRIIYALKQIGQDPSGNRQMVTQKTLCFNEKIKRIAILLAIIQELRFISSSEASQA